MLFKLINALTIFQISIHVMLKKILNFFMIIYSNDMLIFFKSKKKHIKRVRFVLNKFRINKLYVNLEKCQFFVKEIKFLKFLMNKYEIKMNFVQINIIMS